MPAEARSESAELEVVRAHSLLRLSTGSTGQGVRVIGWRVLAFHAVFPAAAMFAGVMDGTLRLPAVGRGVLEHYGYHALFLSAPVLAWMLCSFAMKVATVIADPAWFAGGRETTAATEVREELVGLALVGNRRAAGLLALIRSIGVAAVIANASATRYPSLVYGQDVFDSALHPVGYIVGRVFLTYYWVYLLPLVAYFALVATVATVRVVHLVERSEEHELRCFAADGCGGFRVLGELMIAIVYMYVPIAIVIVALSHTHANFYPTLKLSIVLALLIPAQVFLPFIRLHRMMALLKQRKLARIETLLTAAERDFTNDPLRERGARFVAPYLRLLAGASLYQQATGMTTWPYVRKDAFKWLTPFLPLVVSTMVRQFVP